MSVTAVSLATADGAAAICRESVVAAADLP
jgi:hypothetical protein